MTAAITRLPPDTVETVETSSRSPSSARRLMTPRWKTAARTPPPDSASPIFLPARPAAGGCGATAVLMPSLMAQIALPKKARLEEQHIKYAYSEHGNACSHCQGGLVSLL